MEKYYEIIKASKKDGSPIVFMRGKVFFPDKYSSFVPAPDEEWEIQVKFERDKWGVFVPLKRIEKTEFDWDKKKYILKSGWKVIRELPTKQEEWVILENDRGGVLPRIHLLNAYLTEFSDEKHYDNESFLNYDIDDNLNVVLSDSDIKKISNKKFINEINNKENIYDAIKEYINNNQKKVKDYIEYRKQKKERNKKIKEIKEKIATEWTIEKSIQIYKNLNQLEVEELERDSDYIRYRIVADGVEYNITEGEDMGLEENIINYDEDVIYMYSLFFLALYRKQVLRAMYKDFDNIIREIAEEIKKQEEIIEIKSDEVKEYSFTPLHDRIHENKSLDKDKEIAKGETEEKFEKMNIKLSDEIKTEKEYEFGKILIKKNIKRNIEKKWGRFSRGKEKLVRIPSFSSIYPDDYAVDMPSGTVYYQYVIKVIPEVETEYNVEFNKDVPQLVRNDILHYIEKEVRK